MTYADEARFHADIEMQHQYAHFVMASFTSLKARWKASREQKRRARYASFGLSDDVLRDIGINRSQIMAAEFAPRRS